MSTTRRDPIAGIRKRPTRALNSNGIHQSIRGNTPGATGAPVRVRKGRDVAHEHSGVTRRIAVYMFYDEAGVVGDYVIVKLKALRAHVAKILVVCNGRLLAESRSALESVADEVHVRPNSGFDVACYQEALTRYIGWNALREFDEVLLLNYTFYGPIFPFSEMFDEMESRDVHFWGITAFKGPVPNEFTGSGVIPFHIQSHFIAVRRQMFDTFEFRDYWEKMPKIESYVDSILKHESKFTEHFAKMGFRYSLYSDPKKYEATHPVFDTLDLMLADRCPILKRRPFFHEPEYLSNNNVELGNALDIVKQNTAYDTRLIWKDITRVAKPRHLYTNATLLNVLPTDGEAPAIDPARRIAVFAHVFYPEQLDEILSHAKNIPGHFFLHITTASPEKKASIEASLSERNDPSFTLQEVKVVENRGRDMSSLFIGLRDAALKENYDYVCRLHSKRSPQVTFGMARHFKDHLYDNLLASRAYVGRLLHLFEVDPSLGVVMPPIVHIGFPTLGQSWFNNRPGAEAWASALEIKVPFDEYTPLATYGTMWWFRPTALKRLFEFPFSWKDFHAEPNHVDGGLAHILERLIVYASHQEGFYARSVMTPENAAKGYVKLEYRLQKMIGDMSGSNGTTGNSGQFPFPELKRFVNQRLAKRRLSLTLLKQAYFLARGGFRLTKRLAR
jgi:lipopolysaccharide biosynthesis protein